MCANIFKKKNAHRRIFKNKKNNARPNEYTQTGKIDAIVRMKIRAMREAFFTIEREQRIITKIYISSTLIVIVFNETARSVSLTLYCDYLLNIVYFYDALFGYLTRAINKKICEKITNARQFA